jgi:hypothetical protein
MTRIAVLFALAAMLHALPADAQVQRVFVSGSGNDSNPCTFTQPCRTFAQAFTAAAVNGEIDVLDPAGYGPLTITHAISIQGHGYASITQTDADAIDVLANPADAVLLNGLLLDGMGGGQAGIVIEGAGSVQIVDCVVRHFQQVGVIASYNGNTPITLSISNTVISDDGETGIAIINQPVVLDKITVTGNLAGVYLVGGQATLTNSNVSNDGYGVLVGGGAQVMIKQSVLANNSGPGLESDGTSWLAKTAIYDNAVGVLLSGAGIVNSFGDNTINGNGTDVNGSLTPVSTQ